VIPEFNEFGYLPEGVHLASLDEIASRFGHESEIRLAQMDSVRWLVDLAKQAGIQRMILNGSFVTDQIEPNDVDCALLPLADFPRNLKAAKELSEGLPFIDLQLVELDDFLFLINVIYGSDRDAVPKGVIEVIL
jgi:hypothetical protein